MKTDYQILILGATFFGAQLAAAAPKPVLILEQGILPGCDFSLPLTPCPHSEAVLPHPFGEIIRRHAQACNLHHAPLALPYLLSDAFLQNGIDTWFATRVLGIEKKDGTFYVTVFCEQGELTLTAKEVIDTVTPQPSAQTSLAAVVQGTLPPSIQPRFAMGQDYFVIDTPCRDFTQGRQQLFDLVRTVPGLRIASFAKALTYTYPSPVTVVGENDLYFCPSSSYSDPWSAMKGAFDLANHLWGGAK